MRIKDCNMHKLLGQKKLTIAAVAFTFLWTLADAADSVQGAEGQQTTKDVKKSTDIFDFEKRIVYSIKGMANVVTAHDVVYKHEGDTKLLMNVYSPPTLTGDARLPVVLFVHGGPISADAMQPKDWGFYQSYGELIAASGFVGVTFNHRLFSRNDYGRSQSDVAATIEYVRSHANELHVDANRMALWVYSAGGPHLSWALRERPAGLRCAVAFYSLLDLRPFLPPNADVKVVAAVARLSAAAEVKEYGANLPMFIARAVAFLQAHLQSK
jgi:acetyl esterase/lipase